jgi:subtilase family serine protease
MKKCAAAATAITLAVSGMLVAGAGTANGQTARRPIARSRPSWATPTARVSAAPANRQIAIRVYLSLRDPAGATATARAVSDPTSPSFRHYLSAAQVRARFAPTAASVAAVRAWLRGAGLRPGYVPPNNAFVEATGSVAQVASTFGVALGEYKVRGKVLRAPDRDLNVPASVSGDVAAVIGADESLSLVHPDNTANADRQSPAAPTPGPSAGFRNAPPCSASWGEQVATILDYPPYGTQVPYAPCGYVPQQLRQVYGMQDLVARGTDGRGTTVAIVDAFASPTILGDAQEYARRNDPTHPFADAQLSQIVFPPVAVLQKPHKCDASGWYGEETLDVEAVHATAPGAHILFVGGSDCTDPSLDKALNEVVSKQLAQIVSNSYGDLGEGVPASEVLVFNNIALQAVAEGIGVYFSSGDDGDEVVNLGVPSPDLSASSPWVTAVGGTSLGIGQDGSRVFETGWETTKSTLVTLKKVGTVWSPPPPGAFLYGSGGGTSRLFAQPFYQRGVVPDALATQNQTSPGAKGRVVPDIAVDGDPNTGMLVGQTQAFPDGVYYDQYRIGGTSLSSPLFAGIMAVADDAAGVQHGFVNPVLYQRLAGTSAILDVAHVTGADVRNDFANSVDASGGVVTTIRTFDDQALAIKTTPGYDNVTGLGTPNGSAFIARL